MYANLSELEYFLRATAFLWPSILLLVSAKKIGQKPWDFMIRADIFGYPTISEINS
jgi:hypothetical protein